VTESNQIALFGDFSKTANVLVEKISQAIGGFAKPWQIRRVARADADADMIQAVSQIQISELERRAVNRFIMEEAKKQQNIETITANALPEVSNEARPENVEDDWITNFFDKCRLISDKDMQALWSKVLAGEANSPGKFAKRTVDLLANLDKSDAELFTKLCCFCFTIGGLAPLIYDPDDSIYISHGINFDRLSHMDSIGLIKFDPLAGYVHRGVRQKGYASYYGRHVWLELPPTKGDDLRLDIGHVILTRAGEQLAGICGGQACDGFVEYVRAKWKALGYKTEPSDEAAS
jgi:hypothetical protein